MSLQKTLWPVMLTPFKKDSTIDYESLERLIEWYTLSGADGLFAVCQSSEMFYLSLEERVNLAAFIKAKSTIPVVASGHVSDSIEDQIDEIRQIAATGVDAVILVTNRLAAADESSEIWISRIQHILDNIDSNIILGFYECPYPYKRVLSEKELLFCKNSGRFKFLKDTCCDINVIRKRVELLRGSELSLYNANTATLLDSLRAGAMGFSGVMANFHPELYAWLLKNWDNTEKADILQSVLTMCSQIERQCYPVNAKYHLQMLNIVAETVCRVRSNVEMLPLFEQEVRQMALMKDWVEKQLEISLTITAKGD